MINILKNNININRKLFINFLKNNNIKYVKRKYNDIYKIIIEEYIIIYIKNDYYFLQKKSIVKYKKYTDYKFIIIKTSNNNFEKTEVKNLKEIEKQYKDINFEYKIFFNFIKNKIKEEYILSEYITSETKTYNILSIKDISYKIKNKYYKEIETKEIEKYIIKNFYINRNGIWILKKELFKKTETENLFNYIFYNLKNIYLIENIIIKYKIKKINIEIINGFLNEITFDKNNISEDIKKCFDEENIYITFKSYKNKIKINIINIDI